MNENMTNLELVQYVGLPDDILEDLAVAQGAEWQVKSNQFIEAICNKIVYQTVDQFGWENVFKKFDSFPVNYGDTIENIYVETPEGYQFDKDATDPFTKKENLVKVLYATINYEMQYQATIQDTLLRRAVLTEYGLINLVNSILASLTTAKNVDEYFATIRMLNNPVLYGNSTGEGTALDPKQFAELEVSGTDANKAKQVADKIVDVVSSFQLPSRDHNALGILNASNASNILLIIKRTLLNKINLDYLTGVFNLQKVDIIKNIITVDSFQVKTKGEEADTTYGEDIDFIIMDTRCFDNHVALQDGGMIYNPKGKYTNHFLNLWKIISFKYFYNAEAYKVVEASEDSSESESNADAPAGN